MVTGTFARQVGFVIGAVGVLVLAWRLRDVLVLIFGATVLATALLAGATRIERLLRLPPRWAVVLTLVLVVLGLAFGGWLVGDRFAEQMARLQEKLPAAIEAATAWLRQGSPRFQCNK